MRNSNKRQPNHRKTFTMTIGLSLVLPLTAIMVVYADGLRVQLGITPVEHLESVIESATAVWNQDASDGLDRTLSAHQIQLDDQNRLSGVISGIQKSTGLTIGVSGLSVTLVQRSAEIVRTTTGSDGSFVTNPLMAGSYTLCVSGADGFLAYGVEVVDADVSVEDELLPSPTEQEATRIVPAPQTSLASVREISQDDMAARITAAVIPPQFTALQEIMAGIPASAGMSFGGGGKTQINVKESVIAGGFKIELQGDGRLVGRIVPLKSEADKPVRMRERMNVYLIQDDEIVNETLAQLNGDFVFTNVRPDVYGFAAAGSDGFAALSFHAVQANDDLNSSTSGNEDKYRTVSDSAPSENKLAPAKASNSLRVAISPPEDIPYLRREIDRLVNGPAAGIAGLQPFDPMMAGGPNGGFGGGGGGGYGGAGSDFGGLIELALGAWVLSEVFNNNNNEVFNPLPVSPFSVSQQPGNQ